MRRALLVGIDDYPGAPLAGCVNDAQAMHGLLQVHEDGSPNFDCRLTVGPPDSVTRASLRESIEELLREPADIALFYFSGHGTENNLGGYLVTPDAAKYDEGVAMSDVLTWANNSQVSEVVLILDCCHSGALGQIPSIDRQNDAAHLRQGISVLTATRASESAVEESGSGIFTSLVRSALDGGAADVVGTVNVAGIYAYVDEALGAWDQRPLFKAHVSKLAALRQCQPAVSIETLRLLSQWFQGPGFEFQLDPSFEPDEEPHDVENERVFGELQRCRAAKLVEPVGEDHMYYAAVNSRSCRLTPLGRHYWRLASEGRI